MSAAMASKEALWLQRLMRELGGYNGAVLMHCDSQGAIAMMHNPVSSNRTKHIDVAHHFVRECVESGTIQAVAVGTADMVADFLTKPLPTDAFNNCRAAVGLCDGETDAARVGVLVRGDDPALTPPDVGVSTEPKPDHGGTPVERTAVDTAPSDVGGVNGGRPDRGGTPVKGTTYDTAHPTSAPHGAGH